MKKYLVAALALVCFAGNAMALDNEPQSGFSAQAFFGLSTSQINGLKYYEYDAATSYVSKKGNYGGKCGATLGFKVDYVLPGCHGVYINAGLDYIMKGAKQDFSISGSATLDDGTVERFTNEKATDKYTLHYIELPIHVGFRYNFSKDWGVYGEVGPYFAMGINGKKKYNIDADGKWPAKVEDLNSWKAFKKSDKIGQTNFQRWDAGIGFRIGAEYLQHYSLNLGCDWGITDMYRDSYRDILAEDYKIYGDEYRRVGLDTKINKLHNFALTLTFGYRF